MSKHNHPAFSRPLDVRGLDLVDTPPAVLAPLFAHEPLLAGVKVICEPFAGAGHLVVAMRQRGLTVHASDILDRGCPKSTTLDFLQMTKRPKGCFTLISNPPYAKTMGHIEHAFELGFRVVILLLRTTFLSCEDRYERMHRTGHLRRVHVFAERITMHDAAHVAAGGKLSGQSQCHGWFVFDRDHYGPATINPISIHQPSARMPWQQAAAE